jgi:hypothetical protein
MLNRRERAKARRTSNVVEIRPSLPQEKSSWKANIPLMVLAYSLGIVTLLINASVAYDRGSSIQDKILLAGLFFILEAIVFFLPSQASRLWMQRKRFHAILAWIVYLPLFAFAVYNSQGFASKNLSETATIRSERVTPAVSDAQRSLEAITASKLSECVKRGDRCRQLEKDEQTALEALKEARREVQATADPQITSAARLVSWVSVGRFNPTPDDLDNLRLFFLTLLPQLGGLVLMLSSRS